MKPSSNLENKTPSDTHGKAQLICKKDWVHSSLPLEYNQDQIPLKNQGLL